MACASRCSTGKSSARSTRPRTARMILSVHYVYGLVGLLMTVIAGMSLRDRENPRRLSTALFWGLYAFVFLCGDILPSLLGKPLTHKLIGAVVLLLALIAGL